jgi:hypothetical protein
MPSALRNAFAFYVGRVVATYLLEGMVGTLLSCLCGSSASECGPTGETPRISASAAPGAPPSASLQAP